MHPQQVVPLQGHDMVYLLCFLMGGSTFVIQLNFSSCLTCECNVVCSGSILYIGQARLEQEFGKVVIWKIVSADSVNFEGMF